jgi:hypothetical protein
MAQDREDFVSPSCIVFYGTSALVQINITCYILLILLLLSFPAFSTISHLATWGQSCANMVITSQQMPTSQRHNNDSQSSGGPRRVWVFWRLRFPGKGVISRGSSTLTPAPKLVGGYEGREHVYTSIRPYVYTSIRLYVYTHVTLAWLIVGSQERISRDCWNAGRLVPYSSWPTISA